MSERRELKDGETVRLLIDAEVIVDTLLYPQQPGSGVVTLCRRDCTEFRDDVFADDELPQLMAHIEARIMALEGEKSKIEQLYVHGGPSPREER